MLRRSRTITAGATLAAAVLALAGCAGGAPAENTGGGESAELDVVRIGALPYANVAPLYVGIEQGFFEDHGIKVETQTFQNGAEELQAMVAGELDAGFVGYFTAALAVAQGLPVQTIVNNDQEAGTLDEAWAAVTLVRGDSDIETVADLEGKTFGLNQLKGQAEAQNGASLAAQGADISQVELLEVPMPEMAAALANGSVDAISVGEPFVSAAIEQGARVIDAPYISISGDGGNFPNAGWVASAEFIGADADLLERLVAALEESVEYSAANMDAAQAVIPEFTSLTADQVAAIRMPVWSTKVDKTLLQQVIDLADESGLLKAPIEIDDLLAESARNYR